MTNESTTVLKNGIKEIKAGIPSDSCEKLSLFLDRLFEKNKVMNLTAIKDEKEGVEKHLLDSVFVLNALDIKQNSLLADVGSGAGLPGVPLAVVRPDLKITFIDSLEKRLSFIDSVMRELGLKNYRCVHLRAEQAGQDKCYREKFDYAIARAVAKLNVLSEYCLPLLKKSGIFIAMKGPDCAQEISDAENSIRILGGRVQKKFCFTIPGTDYGRTIIKIEKEKQSPAIYPRATVKITKNPL